MNTLAIIHVAKKALGLDDDTFRDSLERVTGKRSLRAMSQGERRKVIADFKTRGFKVRHGGQPGGKTSGKSTKGYVRLIYALWSSCAKLAVIDDGSKSALRAFVANQTERRGQKVDDPEFLNYDQASPIIETLKSMEARGKDGAQ